MAAKDTVMNDEQQRIIINLHKDIGSRHFYSAGERLCKAQAAISFKAGQDEGVKSTVFGHEHLVRQARLEGIREVMEWVHWGRMSHNREPFFRGTQYQTKHFMIPEKDWQAFLKEKGILALEELRGEK
uniref:Uncharacterized protein n=1 Tax=viral metagenome TaxID=1070528 RepID=A0A6M3LFN5_9ZZZZ